MINNATVSPMDLCNAKSLVRIRLPSGVSTMYQPMPNKDNINNIIVQ